MTHHYEHPVFAAGAAAGITLAVHAIIGNFIQDSPDGLDPLDEECLTGILAQLQATANALHEHAYGVEPEAGDPQQP